LDEGIAGIEKRAARPCGLPFQIPRNAFFMEPHAGPMTVVELHARVVRRRRLDGMMYRARLLLLLHKSIAKNELRS